MTEFFTDEDGKHRFRVDDGYGDVLVTSRAFDTMRDARLAFMNLCGTLRSSMMPAYDDREKDTQ